MILITGSNGFIGSHLAARLAFHDEVVPINIRNPDYTYLRDVTKGKHPTLIHCANDARVHRKNTEMLQKIKNIASITHVNTCIFLNSYATLAGARTGKQDGFNLGFVPDFLDGYASSKLKQEAWLEKELPHIQKVYIYLPAVIGKGGGWDKFFFRKMLAASRITLPSPRLGTFNFISVENVCDAIISLLGWNDSLPAASIRIPLSAPQSAHTGFADLPQIVSSISHKTFEVDFDGQPSRTMHPNFWVNIFIVFSIKTGLLHSVLMPLCHSLKPSRHAVIATSPQPLQADNFTLKGNTRRSAIQSVYIAIPYGYRFTNVVWQDLNMSLLYLNQGL